MYFTVAFSKEKQVMKEENLWSVGKVDFIKNSPLPYSQQSGGNNSRRKCYYSKQER